MRRFVICLALVIDHFSICVAQEMQVIKEHKQQKFPDEIPAGNYSGITLMGDDRYAMVSDKSEEDGFFVFRILLDSVTGKIISVENEGFRSSGMRNRDSEGIAYVPDTQTLFVSGEKDNEIKEYTLDGQLTGRKLAIPAVFAKAKGNLGFESLTYDAEQKLFWTTTESALPGEGRVLRLQSFGLDMEPKGQFLYEMDDSLSERPLVMGVSAICALDGGRLLVLEREAKVTKLKIGSWVHCKLYVVNPTAKPSGTLTDTDGTPSEKAITKELLTEFRTKINLTRRNFANYEGMCMGPRLADGSRTLLMIADSQDQHGGILRDWLKVLVIKPYRVQNDTLKH